MYDNLSLREKEELLRKTNIEISMLSKTKNTMEKLIMEQERVKKTLEESIAKNMIEYYEVYMGNEKILKIDKVDKIDLNKVEKVEKIKKVIKVINKNKELIYERKGAVTRFFTYDSEGNLRTTLLKENGIFKYLDYTLHEDNDYCYIHMTHEPNENEYIKLTHNFNYYDIKEGDSYFEIKYYPFTKEFNLFISTSEGSIMSTHLRDLLNFSSEKEQTLINMIEKFKLREKVPTYFFDIFLDKQKIKNIIEY